MFSCEGAVVDETQIDLIFLPLLAFDHAGFRIGYGKGFYDTFLPKCRKDVVKVGLSLFDPVPRLPAEDHDVPMDYCFTPERLYQFG